MFRDDLKKAEEEHKRLDREMFEVVLTLLLIAFAVVGVGFWVL